MKNIIVFFLTLVSFGCHRRPLESEFEELTRVSVKVYWNLANLRPQNATLLIYDSEGKLYREARVASGAEYAQFNVDMDEGQYTVVAINELRDQIENVRIRGWMELATLEAYTIGSRTAMYAFVHSGEQVQEPGILATAKCRIEITKAMDENSKSFELHPDRKTARSNINITVQGLNNARMPAAAQLRNMASSYFFATDRNSLNPVSAQFTVNNRVYAFGSKTDGTISATITTFGVLGEWHHIADTPQAKFYLDIAFMLIDQKRTVVEMEEDITELIEILVDSNLSVTLNINVRTSPLPNVIPESGGDSGFNTEIVDWDNIKIPLQ